MKLVYIITYWGENEFEEAVVCAKNEEDALSATGREKHECSIVEIIGTASEHIGRGIVCWGLHNKEELQDSEFLPIGALMPVEKKE